MFAGAFGSGLCGTFLVWLLLVVPGLQLTAPNIAILFIAVSLAPVMFYLYYQLLTKDPGYIPLPKQGISSPSFFILLSIIFSWHC